MSFHIEMVLKVKHGEMGRLLSRLDKILVSGLTLVSKETFSCVTCTIDLLEAHLTLRLRVTYKYVPIENLNRLHGSVTMTLPIVMLRLYCTQTTFFLSKDTFYV